MKTKKAKPSVKVKKPKKAPKAVVIRSAKPHPAFHMDTAEVIDLVKATQEFLKQLNDKFDGIVERIVALEKDSHVQITDKEVIERFQRLPQPSSWPERIRRLC